jgi:hypothetical protein
MPRKSTRPIPPIRAGSKAVTYTPPGSIGPERYNRLVFHCEILALRLDGETVAEMDADARYNQRDVRADLRLPDGTEVKGVPYHDQTLWVSGDGSSWCRPFITSMSVR